MSRNIIITRISYYRAYGRALLKGRGNITSILLRLYNYNSYEPYGLFIRGIASNIARIKSVAITY